MYKLKDEEERMLASNEVHDFFAEQESGDQWIIVYTNELEVLPLENNDLTIYMQNAFHFKTRSGFTIKGFASDVEEEEILTSMRSTKTCIIVPINNEMCMYPLRYTAWSHLQDRSGITGGSISSLKARKRATEMPPATRCQCLNDGLTLYKDKTLVLIRNGKVTALLSGDENDYSVMPVIKLLNILESELTNSYQGYELTGAVATHEIASATYDLHDADLEKRIMQILSDNGQLFSNVKVQIRLTTSDVGLCAARLSPIILIDHYVMPIGRSLYVNHKGGAKAMSLYTDIVRLLLAKYRENISNLRNLMKVAILHPADCLRNTYTALKLKGYSAELNQCVERIRQEHADSCTGYDIYWYLNEILYLAEENARKKPAGKSSFDAFLDAQEIIAEVLFMDLKLLDY
ncbi:MAG: hypothetical protein HFI95_08475 [Lachnospiraceae bacterium]|jgi:hypothetical protein|nr:hypothetical protein [Lachnospiraceae bacterium]